MKYRLHPFSFGIKLQDGFEAWKLSKYAGNGLWQLIEANNPNYEDQNIVNQREGLPPLYYVVKRGDDVMEEVKKIFNTYSLFERTTNEIIFEA